MQKCHSLFFFFILSLSHNFQSASAEENNFESQAFSLSSTPPETGTFSLSLPSSHLNGLLLNKVAFDLIVEFSCFQSTEKNNTNYDYKNESGVLWPSEIGYVVRMGKKENGEMKFVEEGNMTNVQGGMAKIIRCESGASSSNIQYIQLELQLEGVDPVVIKVRVIPGWTSLIPPCLAIVCAIITRQVFVSLFLGIYLGSFLIYNYNPISAFYQSTQFFVRSMTTYFNSAMIIFLFSVGGLMGLILFCGGVEDFAQKGRRFANTTKKGGFFALLMGFVLFMSSIMSMLLCGLCLRSIADKLRMAREKLAFYVDSTASPVASLVPISAWFGYEVGLVSDQFAQLRIPHDAYVALVNSIPFRLYCLLLVWLIFLTIVTRRDYGPMYSFERATRLGLPRFPEEETEIIQRNSKRSSLSGSESLSRRFSVSEREEGRGGGVSEREEIEKEEIEEIPKVNVAIRDKIDAKLSPPDGVPKRWWNAALPLSLLLILVILGLTLSGLSATEDMRDEIELEIEEAKENGNVAEAERLEAELAQLKGIGVIYSNATSMDSLLWASFMSSIVTIISLMIQKIVNLSQAIGVWITGSKMMTLSVLILVFAWAIGDICKALRTGEFLVSLVGDSLDPYFLPLIIFCLSAIISFSTGTSFGTMAIVYPLSISLAWSLEPDYDLLVATLSSVVTGSIFGDHCSPISDSTILSAMFSGCATMDHVITQLPYALTLGATALILGYLPFGFQIIKKGWLAALVCAAGVTVILFLFGKRVPNFELGESSTSQKDLSLPLAANRSESSGNREGVSQIDHDSRLVGDLDESCLFVRALLLMPCLRKVFNVEHEQ